MEMGGTKNGEPTLNPRMASPFSLMPLMETYDGKGYPLEHINNFEIQMEIHKVSDNVRCKVFLDTLVGVAKPWFWKYHPK